MDADLGARVEVMSFGLLVSVAISAFAFGGVLLLLRALESRRFMILVAATASVVGAIVLYQISRAISLPLTTTITISDFRADYPGLVLSTMGLMAVFYLERLIRELHGVNVLTRDGGCDDITQQRLQLR